MKRHAARPFVLALSLVLLAMPLGRSAFAQITPTPAVTGTDPEPQSNVTGTDPEPQSNVTGTDPEPQGDAVETMLAIVNLS
jgi:hypothetical protein